MAALLAAATQSNLRAFFLTYAGNTLPDHITVADAGITPDGVIHYFYTWLPTREPIPGFLNLNVATPHADVLRLKVHQYWPIDRIAPLIAHRTGMPQTAYSLQVACPPLLPTYTLCHGSGPGTKDT